jgi:hypothetical protein
LSIALNIERNLSNNDNQKEGGEGEAAIGETLGAVLHAIAH